MNIHDVKRAWYTIAALSRSGGLGFSKVKFPDTHIVHHTAPCDVCEKEAHGVVTYGDTSICAVCLLQMQYRQEAALERFQKHMREKAIEDGLREWGKTP